MTELFKKYRPKVFKDIVGQPEAVNTLKQFFMYEPPDVPHTLLFIGPSGTGKTTLARIIANKLGCRGSDLREHNASSSGGIDAIRSIERQMRTSPIQGNCRVWIIDEAQGLSADAQGASLKMLEDTPKHVYFMLCTTDPGKLKDTIINRSTSIKLKLLTPNDMQLLLTSIIAKEEKKIEENVIDEIINLAEGSPREALVTLNQIIGLKTVREQLDAITPPDIKRQAYDIFQLLLKQGVKWPEMAKVLSEVKEEPEKIRRLILACATTTLLKKSWDRPYLIINSFRDDYFSCGKAGLIASCYEVITTK